MNNKSGIKNGSSIKNENDQVLKVDADKGAGYTDKSDQATLKITFHHEALCKNHYELGSAHT